MVYSSLEWRVHDLVLFLEHKDEVQANGFPERLRHGSLREEWGEKEEEGKEVGGGGREERGSVASAKVKACEMLCCSPYVCQRLAS